MSRGKGYVKMFTLHVEPEKWGFAVIPADLVMGWDVSSDAKVLYALLSLKPQATLFTLAAYMQCSQRSISKWMKELRDAGVVINGEF